MHVIYIHQHFATKQGATGTRSYEWSQRLLRAGHRVTMICGEYAPGGIRPTGGSGVSEHAVDGIRELQVPEYYEARMGLLRRAMAFGRFARVATRIVKSLQADLVFATSTPLTVGIPGMKGARYLHVPFVFEVRDVWPEILISAGALRNPLLIWYGRRLERRIYAAARHIVALSPGIKDSIAGTGYPAERITMIPNASDVDLFKPDRTPLDDDPRLGPPGSFRVVFTGAHGFFNGLDAVLDAAAELLRRGERSIQLVFIGGGRERDRLIERSRREGLDAVCRWVSPIPKAELARVLPRMDVGLMVLIDTPVMHYGTSPNKFFDYIACGLPVVNNYPGWLADMIREHDIGRAVPPGDPAAFADALIWLRDHPRERAAMAQRARTLAETRFSRDLLGERFVQTLERVHGEFHRGS
ncbi:MAG: glycosyltransferase family 4 protein [Planctomycetes bacterium]|nr:glycosyltransferase family 4 protein [Planctomycetota bacterium]